MRLNRGYADAISHRGISNQSMTRQLQEARWLLRSIEQRFATIQRVADAIVARQRGFFEYGEVAMKPLTLKLIAGELGLHESTVCRVTNNKYMATPRGLFEFKHFFSRKLATDSGGAASATAVRAVMKELIAAEDPRAPLSDAELARLLAQQGLKRGAPDHHQVPRADAHAQRGCAARRPEDAQREEWIDGSHHRRPLRRDQRGGRRARGPQARRLRARRGGQLLRLAPGAHDLTRVGGDVHSSAGSRFAGRGALIGAVIGVLVGRPRGRGGQQLARRAGRRAAPRCSARSSAPSPAP